MKKVTIEQAENGYLVTTDEGKVFVAEKIVDSGYSRRAISIADVLKDIFESEPVEVTE